MSPVSLNKTSQGKHESKLIQQSFEEVYSEQTWPRTFEAAVNTLPKKFFDKRRPFVTSPVFVLPNFFDQSWQIVFCL